MLNHSFQISTQLHVIIKVDPDQVIEPDVLKLEHALTEMAKTWAERFMKL